MTSKTYYTVKVSKDINSKKPLIVTYPGITNFKKAQNIIKKEAEVARLNKEANPAFLTNISLIEEIRTISEMQILQIV